MAKSGFGIGKIFGIDIRIDWSWLLIFLLVTWNLATFFGQAHPQWTALLDWGTAVIAALLFFASVLGHELAHSLVARAQGVPVRSITLFLFGGVSNIQREPESPGREFVMAVVGPLTSIVLGGLLLLLGDLTTVPLAETLSSPVQTIAQLSPLTTLLLWLGSTNVLVGLFNLVPGFPLDGGRVLRSVFWATTKNLQRATRWASWAGQGIAWLMILAGIAMLFNVQLGPLGGGLLNGLWFIFIGWFLNSASSQSYQQVVVHDILSGVQVSRIMRIDPPTVPPDCSVSDLVHEHILGKDDQAFPVMEGEQLVGLVTLHDVRKVPREAWDTTTVRQAMTPGSQLVTASAEEDASAAWDKMGQRDLNQLPVLQDGHLVGLLRRRDLIRWLQLHAQLMQS